MLNGVQIVGHASNIETKSYPDGAVISYFDLCYPRATRTDVFRCRIIQRKGAGLSRAFIPEEDDMVVVAGSLTSLGVDGKRTCIDVKMISLVKHWRI